MKKLLLLLVLPFLFTANAFSQKYAEYQDVVYLKNGSIIRGIIIEQIPSQSLKIETAGGSVFVYVIDEIEKIVKEPKFGQESKVSNPNTGLKRGYRGIVDFATVFLPEIGIKLDVINGYQFNPYVSLGFGVGFHWYFGDSGYYHNRQTLLMPLFADLRINFLNKKVSPYMSLGIGYSFDLTAAKPSGMYFAPTCGVRFKFNEKVAMNLGLGFGFQGVKYDYYDYYEYYSYSRTYYEPLLNLTVGVSF